MKFDELPAKVQCTILLGGLLGVAATMDEAAVEVPNFAAAFLDSIGLDSETLESLMDIDGEDFAIFAEFAKARGLDVTEHDEAENQPMMLEA